MFKHPQIKFSHQYPKLPEDLPFNAILLDSYTTDLTDISAQLLSYDTAYYVNGEVHHYPLPAGKLIVLLLYSPRKKQMFTTIRRWTAEKGRYYRSRHGQLFECIKTGSG